MEWDRPGSDARLAAEGGGDSPPSSFRHQDGGTTSQSRVTRTKGEARPSAVNPFHTMNLSPERTCLLISTQNRAHPQVSLFVL